MSINMQDQPLKNKQLGLGIRSQFPIFQSIKPHYLDTAASSQKPTQVIERIRSYFSNEHANIHRGAYALSAIATENYEKSKVKVAEFIGAENASRIIFTKGATESINLAASAYADNFKEGDSILITLLEHHSNIVPWQMLAKKRKLNLHFTNITNNAQIDMEDFRAKLKSHKPKLAAFTHIANSFGSISPAAEMIMEAQKVGAKVLLDAAQSVQHEEIDVRKLGVDFLAFSGHKIYGPTGIGVLYVKPGLEEFMTPYQGGGDMISYVSTEGSGWADFPQCFEAGTPPIAEAIALGEALDFLSQLGINNIKSHEQALFIKAWDLLSKHEGLTLYGPAAEFGPAALMQASIISFNLAGVHAHDLSTVADTYNVQIRAGHHCAMPALKKLGIASSARASIGVYSDISDFEALLEAVDRAKSLFCS